MQDRHHQHQTGKQPRDDARKEHPADGNIRADGIDNHDDGGWDQDAERARVADHTGGEFLGVADLPHSGDDDRADGHHRGGRRPARAANIIQAKTPAMASPPGRCPTQAMENRIIRRATPPVDMNDDASTKNGIASSV